MIEQFKIGILFLILPTTVSAYCSEPSTYLSPPDAPGSYQEPDEPYCLSGYKYSGTHTCSEWEIDNYIDEINEYIEELQDYVAEANEFAQEALNFADDALLFTRCKADEATEPLE